MRKKSNVMSKNVKIAIILLLCLLWALVSWRWYTCGIKGICDEQYKVDINNIIAN